MVKHQIALAITLQVMIMGNAFADHEVGDFGQRHDETRLKEQLGFHEQKRKDAEAVVRKCTAILAADPDDVDVRMALCQAHVRYGDILREQSGEENKAISEYRAALLAIVDADQPTQEAVDKRDYQPQEAPLAEAEVNRRESIIIRKLKKRARKALKELTKESSPRNH